MYCKGPMGYVAVHGKVKLINNLLNYHRLLVKS